MSAKGKSMTDLREAVARAIAPELEGQRRFDQMPQDRIALRQWSRQGLCGFSDATQDDALAVADAAIVVVLGTVVADMDAWLVRQSAVIREDINAHLMEDGSLSDPQYRQRYGESKAYARMRSYLSGTIRALNTKGAGE